MRYKFLKNFESAGKVVLHRLCLLPFRRKSKRELALSQIRKILVLRLDQRIGNGVMLLPLLRAIRHSLPDVQLHLLLHQPVSDIFQNYSSGLINQNWSYQQKKLLTHPLLFFSWLKALRWQKYDLIISSHNPDNFSLSQALLGWWCRSKLLLGFAWQDSTAYYDVAVESSPDKHYADAQLDLWRYFDPTAQLVWGGLKVSPKEIQRIFSKYSLNISEPSVLLWLGATGNKVLSPELLAFLFEKSSEHLGSKVLLALGPADQKMVFDLAGEFQKKVIIWKAPLIETVAFFAGQKVFISGDTGPSHLAAALGLPMITIFTSSKKEQYGYHDGKLRFALSYSGSSRDREEIVKSMEILAQVLTHGNK
jgi:ADP-heptose:LPS heptosyltransferase